MVCYSPLRGQIAPDGTRYWWLTAAACGKPDTADFVYSCGRCVGCCLRRARDLAIRCVHQSRSVDISTCHFLTFTHSDSSLPRLPDGRPTLDKTLMPAMFKRLRKNTGVAGIKFLQVGEYGTQTLRPHYHAVVFGLPLSDLRPFKKGRFGHQLYNSKTLQDAWQDRGHVVAGSFTFDTAQYCARYMLDKQLHADYTSSETISIETGEVLSPQVEHVTMSRGGRGGHGLGFDFFEEHHRRFFALGSCVVGNKQLPIPRYYLDLLRQRIKLGCDDDETGYVASRDAVAAAYEAEEILFTYQSFIQKKYANADYMDDRARLLAMRAKEAYIKSHVRDVVSLAVT